MSAQLKSAVILAGLNSFGKTVVEEKIISRDHTENFLYKNSQSLKIKKANNKKIIEIFGKKNLNPMTINISGDPSSAAFFYWIMLIKSKIIS